ncbi:hypothetical protein NA57DRAFT_60672 [Rhizodiscina lignyota]|uniref:Uncharacterized protein n=1 Tax=Rhizodiscina lignyota TaxID=1504668 RepID=A0A9P4M1I2_9PEZI|nr:hypothetical protein NA57DRAFT_60672 [Rhizodiscina lignyota]
MERPSVDQERLWSVYIRYHKPPLGSAASICGCSHRNKRLNKARAIFRFHHVDLCIVSGPLDKETTFGGVWELEFVRGIRDRVACKNSSYSGRKYQPIDWQESEFFAPGTLYPAPTNQLVNAFYLGKLNKPLSYVQCRAIALIDNFNQNGGYNSARRNCEQFAKRLHDELLDMVSLRCASKLLHMRLSIFTRIVLLNLISDLILGRVQIWPLVGLWPISPISTEQALLISFLNYFLIGGLTFFNDEWIYPLNLIPGFVYTLEVDVMVMQICSVVLLVATMTKLVLTGYVQRSSNEHMASVSKGPLADRGEESNFGTGRTR